MGKTCNNRLTVLGSKRQVQRFVNTNWERRLHGRHGELMENSAGRFVCVFDTDEPPVAALRPLSWRLPELCLFLDYEIEAQRLKGLARAQRGQMHQCQFSY